MSMKDFLSLLSNAKQRNVTRLVELHRLLAQFVQAGVLLKQRGIAPKPLAAHRSAQGGHWSAQYKPVPLAGSVWRVTPLLQQHINPSVNKEAPSLPPSVLTARSPG